MIEDFFDFDIEENKVKTIEKSDMKSISFSQYSLFQKCPHAWKLAYIDKLRKKEDNIHTIFGSTIHTILQNYIKLLYTEGAPVADNYDNIGEFEKLFKKNYDDTVVRGKYNDSINENNLKEFTSDGKQILKWLINPLNRKKYFPSRAYELIGIELPLDITVSNNLKYVGFIDVVLKDKQTGNFKILDIKTSTSGWRDYSKKDLGKTDQLLLYKKFYSELFNVSLDEIEIEFFIVKRKLFENTEYSQSRVSTFEPSNGKISIKKASERLTSFIDQSFTKDGKYKENSQFKKVPGKNKNNCKYCDFYKTSHCDSKAD